MLAGGWCRRTAREHARRQLPLHGLPQLAPAPHVAAIAYLCFTACASLLHFPVTICRVYKGFLQPEAPAEPQPADADAAQPAGNGTSAAAQAIGQAPISRSDAPELLPVAVKVRGAWHPVGSRGALEVGVRLLHGAGEAARAACTVQSARPAARPRCGLNTPLRTPLMPGWCSVRCGTRKPPPQLRLPCRPAHCCGTRKPPPHT